MKCIECQGSGLKDQNRVCEHCNGFGETGIVHKVSKDDIKANGLEGKVEEGEEILIPDKVKPKKKVIQKIKDSFKKKAKKK